MLQATDFINVQQETNVGSSAARWCIHIGSMQRELWDMCENFQLRCEDSQLKLDFSQWEKKKNLLLPFTGQIPVSKEQSIRTHFLREIQSESKAWRRVGHENTETVPRHKRTLSTWFAISSALASIVFLLPNFLYWKKPLFHLVSHLTTCHEQKKILHLKNCLTRD